MLCDAASRCMLPYQRKALAQVRRIGLGGRQQAPTAASILSVYNLRCYACGPTSIGDHATASLVSPPSQKLGSNSASSKPKGSRFMRTVGNAIDSVTSTADDESGSLLQEDNRGGWDALHARLSAPRDLLSAAAVTAYLQRLQSLLRQKYHPVTCACAVHELGKIVLPSLKDIDSVTVLLLLQTLRMADADRSMPLLQDAAAWMNLYAAKLSLPQATTAIELLLHFDCPVASELAVTVAQCTQRSTLLSLSVARTVPILTALLRVLTYGRNSKRALQSLVQLEQESQGDIIVAEGLRDACMGGEFFSVSPVNLAQLLRTLWTFKRENRALYNTEAATEWRSLEEAVCHILAKQEKRVEAPLAEVIAVMADLVQWKKERSVSDVREIRVNNAQEELFTALLERLKATTARLLSISSESTFTCSIFPELWAMSDVSAVWFQCSASEAAHRSSSGSLLVAGNEDGSDGTGAFLTVLQALQSALLDAVSARCSAEPHNAAALQVAGFICSESVVSWMTSAQRASDESVTHVTSDDPSPMLPDLSSLVPKKMLQSLIDGVSAEQAADNITWTPQMVRAAVITLGNSREAAHRTQALELARKWYRQLQVRSQAGERLQPMELLAFFIPTLLREERKGVAEAVKASLSRWSVSEVLFFFSEIAMHGGRAGGVESMTVLRDSGKLLCTYAAKASASQLVGLVECYGLAQVRSDDFCEAVATRVSELLRTTVADTSREKVYLSTLGPPTVSDGGAESFTAGHAQAAQADAAAASGSPPAAAYSPGVSIAQLARLLRSLALMETRQRTPFVDAVECIMRAADADQGTAEQITQLIAAYAKMLIWSYPVLRALSERLLRICTSEVTLSHLTTAQLALLRMDVTLPSVTGRWYKRLSEAYKPAGDTSRDCAAGPVTLNDSVVHFSIIARLRGHPSDTPLDESVVEVLVERILARADALKMDEMAEVLLSLARLGKGDSAAFQSLTVRTLGMVPKAPPRLMAHVVEAYALAGRGDDTELFTLVADRTVAMRHEMASVTIAGILASFAKAGVRNDRLFIEVIPRVRHVATYGTPRDVVNVVTAYATVNLWHYKLFARLADRAVQLRADFRTPEMVSLLKAYATVQMRYERLFVEFAPRIQTLVHLLCPSDLASIMSSYAQLDIRCPPVWKATAAQAMDVAQSFTLDDAKILLEAYAAQSFFHQECVDALTKRFPELAGISRGSPETAAGGSESASSASEEYKSEDRGQNESLEG
ncbi:hypothetical protein LSCM1_00493 [Leishmania martiniquensis]|uniref:RNA-editing substrate-binding complex 6 protein domain-containing protein n=1 Tax=Leishmania martiniquensis TaxID=1580590 RepID=A0A836FYS9_9TRYP|nr:hypothetical protein LSCM1_00493 [Leishmania martiniquensis]